MSLKILAQEDNRVSLSGFESTQAILKQQATRHSPGRAAKFM